MKFLANKSTWIGIGLIIGLFTSPSYGQRRYGMQSYYWDYLPSSNRQSDPGKKYPWKSKSEKIEPVTGKKVADIITYDDNDTVQYNENLHIRQFSDDGKMISKNILKNGKPIFTQRFFPLDPPVEFFHMSVDSNEQVTGGFISNPYFDSENLSSESNYIFKFTYPDGMVLTKIGQQHVLVEKWWKTRPIGLPKKNSFDEKHGNKFPRDRTVLIGLYSDAFDFTHPYLRPFVNRDQVLITPDPSEHSDYFSLYDNGGHKHHGTEAAGICVQDTDHVRLVSLALSSDTPQESHKTSVENTVQYYEFKSWESLKQIVTKYDRLFSEFEKAGGKIVVESFGGLSNIDPKTLQQLVSGDIDQLVEKSKKISEDFFNGKPLEPHEKFFIALAYATAKHPNILFVASAGNEGSNNDIGPHNYPTSFPFDNVISITSRVAKPAFTGIYTPTLKFNYGKNEVDLVLPRMAQYTTTEDYLFSYIIGTSFASPYVANVAAKMLLLKPTLTPVEIRTILKESAKILTDKDDLFEKIGWGEIDEKAAIQYLQDHPSIK